MTQCAWLKTLENPARGQTFSESVLCLRAFICGDNVVLSRLKGIGTGDIIWVGCLGVSSLRGGSTTRGITVAISLGVTSWGVGATATGVAGMERGVISVGRGFSASGVWEDASSSGGGLAASGTVFSVFSSGCTTGDWGLPESFWSLPSLSRTRICSRVGSVSASSYLCTCITGDICTITFGKHQ